LSRLSFGDRVVALYFLSFYLVPFLIDSIVDLKVKYFLIGSPNFALGFAFVGFYFVLYLYIRSKLNSRVSIRIPGVSLLFSKPVVAIAFILLLALSLEFNRRFNASFRHSNSFAAAGGIAILTFTLRAYCLTIILISASKKEIVHLTPLHYLSFLFSTFLSMSGSYDALFLLAAAYIFMLRHRRKLVRVAVKIFDKFDIIFILFTVSAVGVFGIFNKIGYDLTVAYFSGGGFSELLSLIGNRLFYHFYSVSHHVNNILDSFQLGFEAFKVTIFETGRRLSVLIGIPLESAEIKTAKRLNFLSISPNFRETAGASPGLLGSIFFFPGSILFLPIHIIIIQNISDCFSNIMGNNRKYNLLVYLLAMVIFQAICDSLIDTFNPFGPSFLYLFVLVCASSYSRRIAQNCNPRRNKSMDWPHSPVVQT